MRYRIVDVFSDRPLAGNQLCVVLDPCPDHLMAAVAKEVNLSETTFPTVVADGRYEMRIFTPGGELPFAGHPSLGTAWVLGPGPWTQVTSGATVVVEADADGAVMSQPDPVFEERGPGLWRATVAGTTHMFVPTEEPLDVPDLAAVAELTTREQAVGYAVFRRVDDATVQARVFAPASGIVEDPGTGSAAGPIGVLSRRLFKTGVDITVRQGDEMGRPCRIQVHAADGDIRVGGRVAACAEGRFTL